VFDAIALDYEKVTVITDATAAAKPEIHLGKYESCPRQEYSCSLLDWDYYWPVTDGRRLSTRSVPPRKHHRYEEHRSGNTNPGRMEQVAS
jgi:hypothetical protein